jgi:hypothetical protein
MFRAVEKADARWTENYDEEDGSYTENWRIGEAARSQQHYESMSEPSIVGGASTGKISR